MTGSGRGDAARAPDRSREASCNVMFRSAGPPSRGSFPRRPGLDPGPIPDRLRPPQPFEKGLDRSRLPRALGMGPGSSPGRRDGCGPRAQNPANPISSQPPSRGRRMRARAPAHSSVVSWDVMKCNGPGRNRRFRAGGEGGGRVRQGHGGSSVRLVFIRHIAPAMERPFIARICVRARAGVSAGAVRAPDCPRARQAEDALRLSAEPESARMRVGAGRLRPVMECHIYSHFVMVATAKGFLAGGEGEGRVDDGHGRGSFVPARVRRGRRRGFANRPPRLWSDPLPRAFACGRGRALAPARFARLIARARGRQRTHLACLPNRGRSAPGRCGRDAVHGCRFPRTNHSINR